MKQRLSPRGRRRAFSETSDQKFKTPQQQQQQIPQGIFCKKSHKFVCLFVSFESVTVIRALASLSPRYIGPVLNTMRLTQPLFATRMHMSCVRIENTVLYPCPALICPLSSF